MKPRNRVPILFVLVSFIATLMFGGVASAQQATFQSPILVVNTSFLNIRTGPGIEYTVLVTVVGGTELPVLGINPDGVWYQVSTNSGPGWINREFTLPRGNFTAVPRVTVGEIGAPNLGQGGGVDFVATGRGVTGYSLVGKDIYAEPNYDSIHVNTNVPNDPSTIYPLRGTLEVGGVLWYYIDVPGIGTGWSDLVTLRALECGNDVVGVTTGEVPIRFDGFANRDSYLLPAFTEGYIGGLRGSSNEFVVFTMVDGTTGLIPTDSFVRRSGVTNVCTGVPTAANPNAIANPGQGGGVVVPQLTGNRVIVNTGNLNVRSGPAASFSVVATVSGGTELSVIGRMPDNVWYLVEGSFGQAWLNRTFTLFRGNFGAIPVIREPIIFAGGQAVAGLGQGGGAGTLIGGLGSFDPTTVTTGRSVQGVALIGRDAFVSPAYNVTKVSSNVPNDPNTIYPLLATLEINGVLWYYVNIPGANAAGWMDAVNLRPLKCANDRVGYVPNSVPIRFDGISNSESYLLPVNTEFYIIGIRDQFAIVELDDGTFGLINFNDIVDRPSSVVSVCNGISSGSDAGNAVGSTGNTGQNSESAATLAVTGNRVVINTGNLNVRSGPGAGFSVVTTLPGATEVAVVGRAPDGVWLLVEGTFGRGWVNSEFTLFRGNYGAVPLVNF